MNSDFTSKDTSLGSSGICTVLMVSIKSLVDCTLCRDSLVSGCTSSKNEMTLKMKVLSSPETDDLLELLGMWWFI